ncbi:hypothetical protein OB919_09230 [Halobacteria archaeon AArc-curdl1]|uniref:CopG family transcriptional regulator n=1 Tax=Natronosalvus hydrolyticus TaxID=2979988 RepID=A0AAP2Z8C9_9EURY|nr:hypothetical protein [Halobacteria archaeon AArc-curdl1]
MASEEQEQHQVSVSLPPEVGTWLEDEADRNDLSDGQLCRQLLTTVKAATTNGDFEPADVTRVEALRADLEAQREEFIDHVEDVRKRTIEVKRETDGKAPADHTHEEFAQTAEIMALEERIAALEGVREDLEAGLKDVETTVDSGFENFESILEHLFESTDNLEDKSTLLATAVLDLREKRDTLAVQERRRSEAEQLKLAANQLGVRTATCEACSADVDIALLTEPSCPHCQSTIADVSKKSSFFGTHTLEVGDPPALPDHAADAVSTTDGEELFDSVAAVSTEETDQSGQSSDEALSKRQTEIDSDE